jgi:hypothetical protein
MIRRRELIVGLGSAATWPVLARGQQAAMPVIGFLSTGSADDMKYFTVAFFQGLKEIGYVVGQNVAVEFRYGENQLERLPTLAADLVRRRVAVIAALGVEVALAAQAATTIIPIVFATGSDPVASGGIYGRGVCGGGGPAPPAGRPPMKGGARASGCCRRPATPLTARCPSARHTPRCATAADSLETAHAPRRRARL